jgi:hypothetical protein
MYEVTVCTNYCQYTCVHFVCVTHRHTHLITVRIMNHKVVTNLSEAHAAPRGF